jgi:hypothetical protein
MKHFFYGFLFLIILLDACERGILTYFFPVSFFKETSLPKSKYEEAVYEEAVHINNHTSVWGSWWKDLQWGTSVVYSYCTCVAGIEAAEAATDLMKVNIDRKAAVEG